ncbi:hypothetical protein [Rhodoblastus sp.]|jgi:hypothetical protein|uniref:hypothetical protein n=1 Tax=Rhodoblastus sp. TaxID=1962975 RepID=UPI0025F37F18|nr:hypothetical protein [Rhodoblastus sp.]
MTTNIPLEFTLLECQPDKRAAKKIIKRGSDAPVALSYDYIKEWKFHPKSLTGLDAFKRALEWLATRPQWVIVRGAPVAGLDLSGWHVRQWASDTPTLKAVPRQWIALDIDKLLVPAPLGLGAYVRQAALYVRDGILPPEFHGVRMIGTASGSTGGIGPTTANLRLFVTIDRPIADRVLERWAKSVQVALDKPIDAAVMRTGQLIYTARPVFEGMRDPAPPDQWVFWLDGEDRPVALDLTRYADVADEIDRHTNSVLKSCGKDWRAAASAMVGVSALGEGDTNPSGAKASTFFDPLTRVIGAAVAQGEDFDDVVGFLLPLIAERAAGDASRIRHYSRIWIRQTFKKFNSKDAIGGKVRELTDDDIAWFTEHGVDGDE